MNDRWTRVKNLTRALDTRTDLLNEALSSAESELRALHMNVHASVPLPSGCGLSLMWQKTGKEWGFVIEDSVHGFDTPLLKASRARRCEAAHAIEPLLVKLMERVIDEDQIVTHASDAAHQAIAAIKRFAGES